ncbi:MAG TPA: class I SAM-dependent methyltransferase [Chromatiales bacterium]|nr:class I SAM-dependent methyltransferase [Thiotrichales bacterium]HIP67691.1 class I SAM-dependent methyltransferase [Chromatiales bacterium]
MFEKVPGVRKIFHLPAKIVSKTQEYGPIGALHWLTYQLTRRWREWRLGLRTGELDLGIVQPDEGDNNGYEPVDYLCFDIIMDHIDVIPNESVFLDYGCGKGRAVILAALYPFKKVIGVELSPVMSAVARQHVHGASKNLTAQEVEIVTTDARTFSVPDDVTHIFMFNPFLGEVLKGVLNQIQASLHRKERRLTIMYILPKVEVNHLDSEKWLLKTQTLQTGFCNYIDSYIYETQSE